jgi:hypothetical protein
VVVYEYKTTIAETSALNSMWLLSGNWSKPLTTVLLFQVVCCKRETPDNSELKLQNNESSLSTYMY